MTEKKTIRFQMPFWAEYTEPKGRLVKQTECQALWYYYIMAITGLKTQTQNLVLEGEQDIVTNFERLFRNSAMMYGANVETMANFWPLVDAEIDRQSVEIVLVRGGTALTHLPEKIKFKNLTTVLN